MFVNEEFGNGGGLFGLFTCALVQVPRKQPTYVTLKFINYTLLVNNTRFFLKHFYHRSQEVLG